MVAQLRVVILIHRLGTTDQKYTISLWSSWPWKYDSQRKTPSCSPREQSPWCMSFHTPWGCRLPLAAFEPESNMWLITFGTKSKPPNRNKDKCSQLQNLHPRTKCLNSSRMLKTLKLGLVSTSGSRDKPTLFLFGKVDNSISVGSLWENYIRQPYIVCVVRDFCRLNVIATLVWAVLDFCWLYSTALGWVVCGIYWQPFLCVQFLIFVN